MLPAVEELGIGFVPYSPLGKGFLTGKMDETTKLDSTDFRNILPRFTPEADCSNPGTTKLARPEENIEAASVELPPDELREIESAPSKIKVQGARYPEHLEQITGR